MGYLFPLLQRELVVPLITTRVAGENFVGAQGDTLTMRVGELRTVARKYEWRTRTNPIVLDDIQGGGGIPITFGAHTYSATGLTDEHLRMDEIKLTEEVLRPQTEAVARDLEADVVAAYNALPTRESVDFDLGGTGYRSDPYKVALRAQTVLDKQRRVGRGGRVWLAGANVVESILASDRLSRADLSGDNIAESAIREATIGRIGGLTVVSSGEFDPNFSVITHRSSLVLGTVAPAAPRGAAFTAAAAADGIAMRWLMDYDANFLRDRSIVSMFSGITEVFDEIHLSGAKEGQLITPEEYGTPGVAATPASARAVKVNYTPTADQAGDPA